MAPIPAFVEEYIADLRRDPSSPVWAGSTSASSVPGSTSPGMPRSTPTAAGSSPATGPGSPTSETSPPSTGPPSPASTSSSGGSPASPSPQPGGRKPRRTSAGSGPPSPVAFASYGPDGWSSKMFPPSCRLPKAEQRARSSGTWPRWGLMRNGVAYQRLTSGLPTSASGSLLWATPVAQDDQKSVEAHPAMKARMPVGARKAITSLTVQVKALEQGKWPTPTTSDGTGGPGTSGREGGENLRTAVQHWPTPAARDWKSPSSNLMETNARPLNEVVTNGKAGPLNPAWVSECLLGLPPGWIDTDGPPLRGASSSTTSLPVPPMESPSGPTSSGPWGTRWSSLSPKPSDATCSPAEGGD
jgi:hypothetical protein